MAAADKQREGEENVGVSYKLDHFAEAEEVKTIISSIGSIHHDPILLEAAAERFVGKLRFTAAHAEDMNVKLPV